jgi:ADP-heptose:LPS heptosyltransferase
MKALVIRTGAIGDMVIITPVLKTLHEMGYDIVLYTGKRGQGVLKECPYITKFIFHDEKNTIEQFFENIEKAKKDEKPDICIDFTESIECNVAFHPTQPHYIYPKKDRFKLCNRNYYDASEEWARKQFPELKECQKLPELYFSVDEIAKAKSLLKTGKFNILWQLSGSGGQKVYPWAEYVMGEILKNMQDIHIITTGDEKCQLLESMQDPENITHLAGEIDVRIALALIQFVDLVVAPDTGMLHASGCYEVPKVGLLGHTTIENITKYFKNDYSVEAECACAPCFHLIYDHHIQCPIEVVTGAAWCMAEGIPPKELYARIRYAIGETLGKRNFARSYIS